VIVPGCETRGVAAVYINRQLRFVENKEWSKLTLAEEAVVVVPAVGAVAVARAA
jgi:hypothetical protein